MIERGSQDDTLYELLFDDSEDSTVGAAPLELIGDDDGFEDSGVVATADLVAADANHEQINAYRLAITAEHQRIQGADHYATPLLVERDATPDDIDAAYQIKLACYSIMQRPRRSPRCAIARRSTRFTRLIGPRAPC